MQGEDGRRRKSPFAESTNCGSWAILFESEDRVVPSARSMSQGPLNVSVPSVMKLVVIVLLKS